MTAPSISPNPYAAAFQEGRRVGLATGAVALSLVAFINLLGIEKSILAAALAILALHGGAGSRIAQRYGRVALALAVLHAVTILIVIALFHDKLAQLLHLLQTLG